MSISWVTHEPANNSNCIGNICLVQTMAYIKLLTADWFFITSFSFFV